MRPGGARTSVIIASIMLASILAGCIEDPPSPPADDEEPTSVRDDVFVTGPNGEPVADEPIPILSRLASVGERGAEPSVGVTSTGCIFFTASYRVMRSCDHGDTWDEVQDVFSQPTSFDPYLWVDPITDRVFNVQMGLLTHAWVAWSDDDGESWLGNPYDQGPLPVVDHIKLGSGPWTSEGYGLIGSVTSNVYETAVYFCYNKLAGVFCYTSFDGGMTFPIGGQVAGLATSGAGLHGAIATAPDGTVYVTPRTSTPMVIYSKDNGFSWTSVTMGEDAGTPNPRKNSEVAADTESNAYHVWVGEDQGVYLARSTDSGATWDEESLRVSPNEVVSATFPHIDAGDPGRIAVAYLGSENASAIGTPDIDDDEWDGNPHTAPAEVVYHLYLSYSSNALDDEPTFHTVRLTEDPVQVGSICISSGDCRTIGGSNRNLLDFNDLHIDRDGRVHIAYADGCTEQDDCIVDPRPESSRDRLGMVAIVEEGPSLYVEHDPLEGF